MLTVTHYNTQSAFEWYKKRNLIVDFEGGEITTDSGLLLVRQADNALGLVSGLANYVINKVNFFKVYTLFLTKYTSPSHGNLRSSLYIVSR